MNNSKFSDFGLEVKTRLIREGKSQKWLEREISARTGLFMDNGYMYKILTGKKKTPRVISAIREILNMEDMECEYGKASQQ